MKAATVEVLTHPAVQGRTLWCSSKEHSHSMWGGTG